MRYYSTLRPIAMGVLSKNALQYVTAIKNYDSRQFVPAINRDAWGYVETENALPDSEIRDAELTPETAVISEKEKRIKAAYILAENGYSKKEAYHTAMEISMEEIDAIIEP